MNFAVCVCNTGQDGNVAVIVNKVLLPDVYSLQELVKGFVAVSKAKEGVVVPWMVGKAL